MRLRFSPSANALDLRFRVGEAAETIELDAENSILVDITADGAPLGMEFACADDFLPFLVRHPDLDLPDGLVALLPARLSVVA